ncbi:MAG: tRNA (adenosine(37)-N6)-threonylcarbamoyltransferase complex ATPase subunit type 1 TsaE [Nitrospirae bacterium]|nr:tRNA (adenosine(37)-N6)-threonylcarbamoyltransferase complex ATPase subunit type 1 TsaE [Nitrospirota bacterium]MCL5976597.1 tRNA (adenosine(37)-N6)-threonylcarbamoyltransferase complex ATPase subunit type 1 TsaE [Nitrospirota bacterium]
MGHELRIITNSPSETEELGFKLGRFLKANGKGTVLLYGDLGAGKTVFVKGVASAFGIAGRDIGSASFVIAAEYETSPPFYHIDLYRVEREGDIDNLGIWEYIGSGGIAVIEWAERLSEIPEDSIIVKMNFMDDSTREVIIEGIDEENWDHM